MPVDPRTHAVTYAQSMRKRLRNATTPDPPSARSHLLVMAPLPGEMTQLDSQQHPPRAAAVAAIAPTRIPARSVLAGDLVEVGQ